MKKKLGIILAGLVGIFPAVYCVLALLACPMPNHPFFNHDGVLVIAHRGGGGLWPESTMYAFEHAAGLGVDVLEMDVHATRDGQLVVIHDDTVDRTTNGTGHVLDFTLAELRELDAGYNWTQDGGQSFPFRGKGLAIPTLEEVFAAFGDKSMIVEIKHFQPSIVSDLSRLIREHGLTEKVLVASVDTQTLKEFRRICPEVATSAGEAEVRLFYGVSLAHLAKAYQPTAYALQVPEYSDGRQVVTKRFVDTAHSCNMQVHVWTVNETQDMKRLIDLGVDGLVTDYPDRLLTLLGRKEASDGNN